MATNPPAAVLLPFFQDVAQQFTNYNDPNCLFLFQNELDRMLARRHSGKTLTRQSSLVLVHIGEAFQHPKRKWPRSYWTLARILKRGRTYHTLQELHPLTQEDFHPRLTEAEPTGLTFRHRMIGNVIYVHNFASVVLMFNVLVQLAKGFRQDLTPLTTNPELFGCKEAGGSWLPPVQPLDPATYMPPSNNPSPPQPPPSKELPFVAPTTTSTRKKRFSIGFGK